MEPEVVVSNVDESAATGRPKDIVLKLARDKASAVASRIGTVSRITAVIGCDSLLEFEGQAWGKPADAADAEARWQKMRGRVGHLHTGHFLIVVKPEKAQLSEGRVRTTDVHFATATDDEITAYVETGEPMQVAGGFTIDGKGGWLVERIVGDHTNVIGLSLPTLRELIRECGLSVPFSSA